ncbi:YidC/Oxa1 family membrane protein insertase [Candidatus Woesebacteria bacterium]|nr:YidC/Oxa1 family membrane protein insertase [Candidatus Woesebacteria bacterium]MCD8507512.1 YidC/Oxa1 family membrane protein insertase [Candidatus Woesebacteria bacterium]MCD8527325.1 YidC/Oxa1 family membrane protein insertase [Candidatus Woesebacteria bacterium]MCD8545743.1 YidC/Oxa1 family membrane protein insertase [Candidatus Woesebacteria bacterium]
MLSLLTAIVYQPFLNLIVLFYWLLDFTSFGHDMGIAVILLTIVFRLLLLPITLASHRSEKERRDIQKKVERIEDEYHGRPVEKEAAVKRLLRANPRIIFAEVFMFVIQMGIALILWRIFGSGLTGQDLHLLYDWMPDVEQPFDMMFLGRFDLTHPDWQLNLLQSFLIFLVETVGILSSPYQTNRAEVVRVQLVLPVVSFIIFAFLPAGKKLFVITTLCFSLVVMFLRIIVNWYQRTFTPPEDDSSDDPAAVQPVNSVSESLQ